DDAPEAGASSGAGGPPPDRSPRRSTAGLPPRTPQERAPPAGVRGRQPPPCFYLDRFQVGVSPAPRDAPASGASRGGGADVSSQSLPTRSAGPIDLVRRLDLRIVVPALLLVAMGTWSIEASRPSVLGSQLRWAGVGLALACVATAI